MPKGMAYKELLLLLLLLQPAAAAGGGGGGGGVAVDAAVTTEQAQLLGCGVPDHCSASGLLHTQQQQQQGNLAGQVVAGASPEFAFKASGSPRTGMPAADFPAAAVAAGSFGNAELLLPPPPPLLLPPQQQQLSPLSLPPAPLPPPRQQQQQQELVLDLDPNLWGTIAEGGGWCSVARISGANIQANVQPDSPLMRTTVTGTAEQLNMVRGLLQLLLQRQQQQQQCCQHSPLDPGVLIG
jgi:hypothetical protein